MSRLMQALAAATVGLVLGCQAPGPTILAGFGDYYFDGKPRTLGENPHKGLDVAGEDGDPVLAAADGIVVLSGEFHAGCGSGVIVSHPSFGMSTIYCHLAEGSTRKQGSVARGEVIGRIGRTGTLGIHDRSHVHFALRGHELLDPEPYVVGCFDVKKSYPTERLALTYPVKC